MTNLSRKLAVFLLLCSGTGWLLYAQRDRGTEAPTKTVAEMVESSNALLATLPEPMTEKVRFKFDDPERLNWHFIPRERRGLRIGDLEGEQLKTAHRLIRSGLSEAGYDQALNVMSLEEVLYLLEGGDREERRSKRDPDKYYLSIFGEPATSGTWGWRLEGHHLSLNYTLTDGQIVSATPEFYGANPGTIEAGPGRTIRVLGPEEDLARQILKLSDGEKRELAYIDQTPPKEIRFAGEAQPEVTEPIGLSAEKMTDDQKTMLGKLLTEYLKNMPKSVEARRRAEIEDAGFDQIHFAWWGGTERDQPHHYRVQGPTFLIEYNNTQNDANHVHSIWRDLRGDFGVSN